MSGLSIENLRVPKTIKLFIGGEFPRTESGRSFPLVDAESGRTFAHLCQGSRKDFRNAVTAAQSAMNGWEQKSAYSRGQILYRMAEMAEGKRAELIELQRAMGLALTEASSQVDGAINALVYYAGFSDKFQQLSGSINPVSGPHHNFTTPEPVGLVALILDEASTLERIVASISAIIVSGNTLVALLPGKTGALVSALGEIFATSDCPKGAINLISGQTKELAPQVGLHMEVQSVSVQSSQEELLSSIKEAAAENMKRVVKLASDPLSLENIMDFCELKTVWHPIGY